MDNTKQANKVLITYLIESTLLRIGYENLEKLIEILDTDYGCEISDCYEHPEYLDRILTEFYGKSAKAITNRINQVLTEYSEDEEISNFLKVVCKK